MKRIAVITTIQFDNTKGNFEELRQKELAQALSWKERNILDNIFIKSDKNGAMVIFKVIEMEEVVKEIEALPFFPYFTEVKYISFSEVL